MCATGQVTQFGSVRWHSDTVRTPAWPAYSHRSHSAPFTMASWLTFVFYFLKLDGLFIFSVCRETKFVGHWCKVYVNLLECCTKSIFSLVQHKPGIRRILWKWELIAILQRNRKGHTCSILCKLAFDSSHPLRNFESIHSARSREPMALFPHSIVFDQIGCCWRRESGIVVWNDGYWSYIRFHQHLVKNHSL